MFMIPPQISSMVFAIGRITPNGISLLGTSFLLNKEGYFATTAHIVRNDGNNLVVIPNKINSINDYQDTTDTQVSYFPVVIKELNPFADVCILQSDNPMKSSANLGSTDDVVVGETVDVLGYPHSNHGRKILTLQSTEIGAKIILNSSEILTKHIILNIQSRPGQSGSPIVQRGTLKIIAMLIGSYAPSENGSISIGGIDPQTLHQTTHAVSIDYIKEMI